MKGTDCALCQLCDQHLETTEHMILRCVFASAAVDGGVGEVAGAWDNNGGLVEPIPGGAAEKG